MKKLLILALLSGCSGMSNLNTSVRECASYGFKEGTPEMSQCQMTVSQNYQTRTLNAINTFNATTQMFHPIQPRSQQIKMNCMTSSFGHMGNINCY